MTFMAYRWKGNRVLLSLFYFILTFMNNKEYLTKMASRLDISAKEVQRITNTFVAELAERLEDGDTLAVQGFGAFEVKKKLERVVVNPQTKQRMLIPPKLVLSFRPAGTLKDKIK